MKFHQLTNSLLFTSGLGLAFPILSFADNVSSLEVIEVTAQKRVQSLQAIPVAVTALNGVQLEQLQLTEASHIAELVPNLNVTRSIGGAYNYFIRGVGMDDFNLSSIPAVGLYVDNVAIQNPMLANFSLLDVARVEVLRGPQNTLYGKNTTGGAINFISKKPLPGQDTESSLTLYAGNDNLLRFAGSTYFSLGNDSAASLSYLTNQQDSQVSGTNVNNHSQFNNRDKQAIKLRLETSLSENLDLSVALYGGRQNQISEVKTLLFANDDSGRINLDDFDLSRVDSQLINPRNDADLLGGFVKFQWLREGYSVTSVTAFEDAQTERMDDWGSQSMESGVFQVLTYNSTDTLAWSQEFQILSPVTDSGSWLLGALINKEKGDILQTAYIDPAGPGRPDDPVDDAGIGPLFDRGGWVEVDTLTWSVYGQIEVPVQEDLQLTAGLRWATQNLTPNVHAAGMLMDSEQAPFPLGSFGWYSLGNNDFDITQDYAGFPVIENFVAANGGFPATAQIDERFTEWGGKLSLSYFPSQELLLYASVARGFKMGAVNSNPTTTTFQSLLDNTVMPETLTTVEFGFKSEWFDRYLRINGALFHNDWQDYQFFLVHNPGAPTDLFASLVNLPEARTQGLELEVSAIISDSFRFNLGIGYLDAEVRDGNLDVSEIQENFREGFQNSVLPGDRLPNTPEWVINLTLEKTLFLSQGKLEMVAGYQFKDAHIHALAGSNSNIWQHNFSEPTLNLFNASARYSPSAWKNASFHLWSRNITDEQYCSERATIPGTSTETARLCAQGAFREVGFGMHLLF